MPRGACGGKSLCNGKFSLAFKEALLLLLRVCSAELLCALSKVRLCKCGLKPPEAAFPFSKSAFKKMPVGAPLAAELLTLLPTPRSSGKGCGGGKRCTPLCGPLCGEGTHSSGGGEVTPMGTGCSTPTTPRGLLVRMGDFQKQRLRGWIACVEADGRSRAASEGSTLNDRGPCASSTVTHPVTAFGSSGERRHLLRLKSASLMWPVRSSRMLSGLTSLCTNPSACSTPSASTISLA
mmetsp:Transcript_22462/g.56989  ORF Transcript_22462/g.56989 Transcript_22462/m.56989 type:complete len:236 (-) Transcript_22462:490-1197(-)